MKTKVYTTAMLGVAFAACLSACSTKSDVNGKEMADAKVSRGKVENQTKGIQYVDFIGRNSVDSKVFDGEETITLLTNNVETDDSMAIVSNSVVI